MVDYTGEKINTRRDEYISVRFQEDDEEEGVFQINKEEGT